MFDSDKLSAQVDSYHEDKKFALFLSSLQDFLDADAASFDQRVPPKRALRVKKVYKLLKEKDPKGYKLLKPFRTVMGEIDDYNFVHSIEYYAKLMAAEPKGSPAWPELCTEFCINFVEAIFYQIEPLINRFQSSEEIEQNPPLPKECVWLGRFNLAYIVLSHYTDRELWSQPEQGDDLKSLFDTTFALGMLLIAASALRFDPSS